VWKKKQYATVYAADLKRSRTPVGRLQRLVYVAKQRAKRKGLSFGLTLADLLPPPQQCPVLGIPLHYGAGRTRDANRASLDRRDNKQGYMPSNVRVISYRANSLKSDATLAEMRRLVEYMEGK
jgi:hypothetical protein